MGLRALRGRALLHAFVVVGGMVLSTSRFAHAAATQGDLMVAARALGFIQNPPRGEVAVGIIYVAENTASVAEAKNIARMMGDGLRAGLLTLKPILVQLDDVAAADVGLFFLTEDIGEAAMRVGAAARAKRIPCVTVDLAQVRSGACVMGVRSQPKVEILVNRASAADTGVSFAVVFRMMITEF